MSDAKRPARSDFIAAARTWEGRPYNASGAQACGANCLGLFVAIARGTGGLERLAAAAEPHVGHAKPPARSALLRALRVHLDQVRPGDAKPGDLLLFNVSDEPRHLAILTEPNVILHADALHGRVVQHRLPRDWHPVAAFRIRELV
jgi:cell wall-associated NlpC family hydrolase